MTTMHKTTSVLMGLILMSALVGVALAQGECSPSNPCADNKCCSQFGFCGCGDPYCGEGCIDNCNGCRRGNAHTMLTGIGECSPSNPCQDDKCCSQFGFCGCGEKYCEEGCIYNCNGCNGRLADSSSQATYYTKYLPTSCYGNDASQIPRDKLFAAVSTDVFGNKEACGAYYEITCKGATSGGSNPCKQNPTVKVKVVDLCPGCNKNSFDLSKEAFSKIADLDAGRINISVKRVSKYHKSREETITQVV